MAQPVVAPDLSKPLINEPAQANPPADPDLGALRHLAGTWVNKDIGTSGRGGPENPFSYNLMILPQPATADPGDPAEAPFGYILKNMTYYEEITFSAIHGSAANRGGDGSQIVNGLTYEQRVYISDGPARDTLVHFENGVWGFVVPMAQALGPYGDGDGPSIGTKTFGSAPPPLANNIFKQISVPHGNSVLACGNVPVDANNVPVPVAGAPTIGPPRQVLPHGIGTSPYFTQSVQNPVPAYAQNPNQALIDALNAGAVKQYIEIGVDSTQGGGSVGNISYEQARAEVVEYYATYWLEDTGAGTFDQLQYSQTMLLKIPVTPAGASGPITVVFPHITTNTLTRA
ncbi:MAG: heme-binding protein [Novosphingobium sp.]